MNTILPPSQSLQPKARFVFPKRIFIGISVVLVTILGVSMYQWSRGDETKDQPKAQENLSNEVAKALPQAKDNPTKEYIMPAEEKDRLDILIMGIRGENDPQNGGMLTDSILVLSFDKTTHKSSLISIPRDFLIWYDNDNAARINTAYETLGLSGTKKLVSKITGVYIDNIVVFDFSAFKKIVDDLGGVDVTLSAPFKEAVQWGYTFSLPAGVNHLNGQDALYYARSRFTSNDFDRARRQQEIILAIKQKIGQTNFLAEPDKAFALVSNIKRNMHTDLNILDAKMLMDLAKQLDTTTSMKRMVLSTSNVFNQTILSNGMYVLLPRDNTIEPIKKIFRESLTVAGTPVISATPLPLTPTPSPSPTPSATPAPTPTPSVTATPSPTPTN
ncbi:MAG: LCP family protein [Candidatus Yanofskybacteria bacterium]|nr:LCP family protein [Candidatus Yanofskybacteria bacterium]